MKILKYLFLFFIAAFFIVLLVGIFTSPNLKVEAERTIDAPVSKVYAQVADFKKWKKWNVWQQMDENISIKYGPKTAGVGAYYTWMSEKQNVGSGKMTITKVAANESLEMELDFGEMGISDTYWKFIPEGNKTKVINGFTSELGNNPFTKFMFGIIAKSGMKGNLNQGLENIAKIVE